ncbi:DUF3306 domain-containing protein [Vibrio chagasii]|uniref:DUF3306 domain-containing protein n=1 Tax=Vibrio chagasii TaxID=170679 RepID=UPI0022851D76|nr:DUF3306 domain-containing protein [Vibrio chagasii]MCY9826156.1 DUF3306 domain-containing protein [Vibrio chagasii]
MATNFFSRWSQRKLDDSADQASQAEQTLESDHKLEEVQVAPSEASTSETSSDTLSSADAETSESLENAPDTEIEATQDGATEASEDLSVAQLLVSEASESVKKAALRKLFLSEEFNVRDGLDDYDDDYSNLKSLSEDVAETLRDWVKDKTEEDTAEESSQDIENKEEDSVDNVEEAESELVESDEITGQGKELYKNTVPNNNDTESIEDDLKEVGQNIPHKE